MSSTTEASHRFFSQPLHVALLALVCTFLWASAVPVLKIGYEWFAIADGDVATRHVFAGVRFFLAGLMLLLFYAVSQKKQGKKIEAPPTSALPYILLLAFFQTFLEYAVYYIGVANTSSVRATILIPSSAFFALLLAHILVPGEHLTPRRILGCCLGFGGILLNTLTGEALTGSFRLDGELLILLSSLAFACGSIVNRYSAGKTDPVLMNAWQLTLGGLGLVVLGLLCGGQLQLTGLPSLLLFLYLCLLSAVSFTLWSTLLQHNPVAQVSVYSFTQPIFGLILSALLLGESFWSLRTLLALVLVCAGIYIVNAQKRTS